MSLQDIVESGGGSLEPTKNQHAASEERDRAKRDLKAQEQMAYWARAMFWPTLAGVFVTAAGVFLVWRTLIATKEAAKYAKVAAEAAEDAVTEARKASATAKDAVAETSRIGQAQVRAYLHWKAARYRRGKNTLTAILTIENTGQSPASNVSITGTATMQEVGGHPTMGTRVHGWVMSKKVSTECQPITARGVGIEEIDFEWDWHFEFEDENERKWRKQTFTSGNSLYFDLIIRWSDVFGTRHAIPADLSAIVDATPDQPKRNRSRAGALVMRMSDARHGVSPDEGDDD